MLGRPLNNQTQSHGEHVGLQVSSDVKVSGRMLPGLARTRGIVTSTRSTPCLLNSSNDSLVGDRSEEALTSKMVLTPVACTVHSQRLFHEGIRDFLVYEITACFDVNAVFEGVCSSLGLSWRPFKASPSPFALCHLRCSSIAVCHDDQPKAEKGSVGRHSILLIVASEPPANR